MKPNSSLKNVLLSNIKKKIVKKIIRKQEISPAESNLFNKLVKEEMIDVEALFPHREIFSSDIVKKT